MASRLRAGERLIGSFHGIGEPALVELAAREGFDFVVIELEHGLIGLGTAERMVRAAEAHGVAALVRCHVKDVGVLPRFLDAGAEGGIVAHITGPADMLAAVQAAHYPPGGTRGIGYGRWIHTVGRDGALNHVRTANDDVVLFAIVEHPDAVASIDDILAVPGLSGVLPGSGDLALAQGLRQDTGVHPLVAEQLARVRAAASKAERPVMDVVFDEPGTTEAALARGSSALLFGIDALLIASTYRRIAATARAALSEVE